MNSIELALRDALVGANLRRIARASGVDRSVLMGVRDGRVRPSMGTVDRLVSYFRLEVRVVSYGDRAHEGFAGSSQESTPRK